MGKKLVDEEWLQGRFHDYHAEKTAALARGEKPPMLPEDVLLTAWGMANRFVEHGKFRYNPEDVKLDMVVDGYILFQKYGHNYDPNRFSKPFAYITKILETGFYQRAEKENRQKFVQRELLSDVTNSFFSMTPDGEAVYVGDTPAVEDRRRLEEEQEKFDGTFRREKSQGRSRRRTGGLEGFF